VRRHPTWPVHGDDDPWDADLPAPPHDLGTPPRPEVAALFAAVRAGRHAEATERADALRLVGDRPRLTEVEARVPAAATVEQLVRIAADWHPAVGNEAPDLVLGPWADVVDGQHPDGRRLLAVALASGGLERADGAFRSAVEQWARQSPSPPQAQRDAARAVARAPWSLWRRDGAAYVDVVGVSAWGLVAEVDAAPLPGQAADSGWCVARVVGTHQGAVAPLAIALPGAPPPALVRRAVDEAVWRARVAEPRRDVAESMAACGSVFVRRLLEWAWTARG
jgi:hypothetical protein